MDFHPGGSSSTTSCSKESFDSHSSRSISVGLALNFALPCWRSPSGTPVGPQWDPSGTPGALVSCPRRRVVQGSLGTCAAIGDVLQSWKNARGTWLCAGLQREARSLLLGVVTFVKRVVAAAAVVVNPWAAPLGSVGKTISRLTDVSISTYRQSRRVHWVRWSTEGQQTKPLKSCYLELLGGLLRFVSRQTKQVTLTSLSKSLFQEN